MFHIVGEVGCLKRTTFKTLLTLDYVFQWQMSGRGSLTTNQLFFPLKENDIMIQIHNNVILDRQDSTKYYYFILNVMNIPWNLVSPT